MARKLLPVSNSLAALKLSIVALLELGVTPEQVLDHSRRFLRKRRETARELPEPLSPPVTMPNGAVIDLARREIRYGSKRIRLYCREVQLLDILLSRPGEPVPAKELERLMFGDDIEEVSHPNGYVRNAVYTLRKKLGEVPGGERWIVTVQNYGYSFQDLQE